MLGWCPHTFGGSLQSITPLVSTTFSRFSKFLKLRRDDQRLVVGTGGDNALLMDLGSPGRDGIGFLAERTSVQALGIAAHHGQPFEVLGTAAVNAADAVRRADRVRHRCAVAGRKPDNGVKCPLVELFGTIARFCRRIVRQRRRIAQTPVDPGHLRNVRLRLLLESALVRPRFPQRETAQLPSPEHGTLAGAQINFCDPPAQIVRGAVRPEFDEQAAIALAYLDNCAELEVDDADERGDVVFGTARRFRAWGCDLQFRNGHIDDRQDYG